MAVFNDLSEFMLQPSTYYGLEYITEFKNGADDCIPFYHCKLHGCFDEQGRAKKISKHLDSYAHKQAWLKMKFEDEEFKTRAAIDHKLEQIVNIEDQSFESITNRRLWLQCKKARLRARQMTSKSWSDYLDQEEDDEEERDLFPASPAISTEYFSTEELAPETENRLQISNESPPTDFSRPESSKYSPWPETTLKSPAGPDQAAQDQSVSEVIREGPVDGRADLERDTSYPESESADPECESDDPECESAEPENEIAGPESETADPEINTADPEIESTEPGRRPEADIINVASHDTNSAPRKKRLSLRQYISQNSTERQSTEDPDNARNPALSASKQKAPVDNADKAEVKPKVKVEFRAKAEVKPEVKAESGPRDLIRSSEVDIIGEGKGKTKSQQKDPEFLYKKSVRDYVHQHIIKYYKGAKNPPSEENTKIHTQEQFTKILKEFSTKIREDIRVSWNAVNNPGGGALDTPKLEYHELWNYPIEIDILKYFEENNL